MKQSESINGLLKALCELQAELPTMPKDTDGYGYKYTNLDTIVATIKPLLAKHGLGYVQPITTAFLEHGKTVTAITTRIFNSDGEYMEDTAALPEISVGKTNAAQNIGAAITYMRRYGLCSMLGITSDEDVDGNAQTHMAMQQSRPQPQRQQQRQQPPRNNAPKCTLAGGPDTPEETETINNLLQACDNAGNPLFSKDDYKTVSDLRKTDTAKEVIRKLHVECEKRSAARNGQPNVQPNVQPEPAEMPDEEKIIF